MSNTKATKKADKKPVVANPTQPKMSFIFKKENYMLTVISLVVIVIGFILMSGSEGDIYDFRRTTLAPIVVLLGFGIAGFSIFYKSKTKA